MKKTFKIEKNLGKYRAGTTIDLDCIEKDGTYIPKDNFWKRRYKDSFSDGCLKMVVQEIPQVATKKEMKKEEGFEKKSKKDN